MFVWNILGTDIKDSPTKHSKTLKKLEIGQVVRIAHFTKDKNIESKHSSLGDYPLTASWLLVEYETESLGYVFAGDLSERKPRLTSENERIILDYNQYLGFLVKDSAYTIKRKINDQSFKVKVSFNKYEYGTYKLETSDGCFDHYYTFRGLEFNEAFFLMMSMYGLKVGDETILPSFSEEINGQIKFWGLELTFEIIMTRTEKGWQIYSYDCT